MTNESLVEELEKRRALEPGIRAIVKDRCRLKVRVEKLEAEVERLRLGSLNDATALERMGHGEMAATIRRRIKINTLTA